MREGQGAVLASRVRDAITHDLGRRATLADIVEPGLARILTSARLRMSHRCLLFSVVERTSCSLSLLVPSQRTPMDMASKLFTFTFTFTPHVNPAPAGSAAVLGATFWLICSPACICRPVRLDVVRWVLHGLVVRLRFIARIDVGAAVATHGVIARPLHL